MASRKPGGSKPRGNLSVGRKMKQEVGQMETDFHSATSRVTWGLLESFAKATELMRTAGEAVSDIVPKTDIPRNSTLHSIYLDSSGLDIASVYLSHFSSEPSITFEVVNSDVKGAKRLRNDPLTREDWLNSFDSDGRLHGWVAIKDRIFRGGIERDLRPDVWKYLFGYYPISSTSTQREAIDDQKHDEYGRYKLQWVSMTEEQLKNCGYAKKVSHAIRKDVPRTDRSTEYYKEPDCENLEKLFNVLRTFSVYHQDLSYVQGMNDICSVMLVMFESEPETFWCFKGIMDRLGNNFHKDQQGMGMQLERIGEYLKELDMGFYYYLSKHECLNFFFCFRWVLILFKREVPFEDIPRLWEAIVSHHDENFHLFVVLGVLLKHKNRIMREALGFDDLLRYFNECAGKLDPDELLIDAEDQYGRYKELMDFSRPVGPTVPSRLDIPNEDASAAGGAGDGVASSKSSKASPSSSVEANVGHPSPMTVGRWEHRTYRTEEDAEVALKSLLAEDRSILAAERRNTSPHRDTIVRDGVDTPPAEEGHEKENKTPTVTKRNRLNQEALESQAGGDSVATRSEWRMSQTGMGVQRMSPSRKVSMKDEARGNDGEATHPPSSSS